MGYISKPLNNKLYVLEDILDSKKRLRKTASEKGVTTANQNKEPTKNSITPAGYAALGLSLPALYLLYYLNKKYKQPEVDESYWS